jgi:RNA polymerase sigma-70 factor, ECF subfamily
VRQLFDRVYPILVRLVYRRVHDVDLAEDIAQEAFVRLLNERPDKPQAWLFTVAGNLAKNALRGEHRRSLRLSVIATDTEGQVASDADRLVLQHETDDQVRTTLESLSERDRTLLLLHHDGLSYKELAEIIGVKPSSIAPLLGRARQRFLKSIALLQSQRQSTYATKDSAS